jgi:hypothetical protein
MPYAHDVDVLIKTLYDRTGVKASLKDLDRLKYKVNSANQVIDAFGRGYVKNTEVMKQFGKTAVREARRFKAEWLSVMFFSMAINRALTRIGTTALAEFKRAHESTSYWNSAVGRLAINFTFLRIALGETINRVLRPFADWIDENMDKLLDLVSKEWLVKLGFDVFTTTALAGAIATAILGVKGIQKIVGAGGGGPFYEMVLGLTFLITGIKEAATGDLLSGLKNIFSGIGLMLVSKKGPAGVALIATGLALSIVDIIKKDELDLIDALNTAFLAGIVGFKLGGWWGAGVALVVTLAIGKLAADMPNIMESVQKLKNRISAEMSDIFGAKGRVSRWYGGITGRQFGGTIPATGLYKMHAGEQVYNPTFASTVNVTTGPVSSSVDVNRIAEVVSSVIMRDIKKRGTPVSQYG